MDTASETVPLDEALQETIEYSGRTYQKYALTNGIYFAPIDEDEVARLELMHTVLCRVFDHRLIFPTVNAPKRILDCGFGAAHWAVDIAEEYPDCDVIGIDISPHMIPEDQPNNLDLQIDDLNNRFTFASSFFDVVHSQFVSSGIQAGRWRTYVRDILRVLRPGGWCQLVELYLNAQSDNGTLSRDHGLSQWSREYLAALGPQKEPRAALQLETLMLDAGFTDVEVRLIPLPMCPWPSDGRERGIGAANKENIARLLYSLGLYPMTKLRGMPIADFERLAETATNEASNPAFKAYFPLYVCIGRKPRTRP